MTRFRRLAIVAVAVAALVASCSDSDSDSDSDSNARSSEGASTAKESDGQFMVLAADGWTLTGASTVSDAATSGLRWNLSYEHAGGDEGRSAALALFDRDKARGLATQLDPGSTDATVDGQAVSLAEERSPQDNHLVAIHAMWDTKDGVGWLTVYGSTRDDALHLVRDIELVSEQEWRAATAAVSEADRQQR